jgi:hypothetical protein
MISLFVSAMCIFLRNGDNPLYAEMTKRSILINTVNAYIRYLPTTKHTYLGIELFTIYSTRAITDYTVSDSMFTLFVTIAALFTMMHYEYFNTGSNTFYVSEN